MIDIFNSQYHKLVSDIIYTGKLELNQRTGVKVKSLPHQSISIPITDFIPVVGSRKIYPKSAAAELAWVIGGDKNIQWLQQYTKMWDKFTNEQNEIDCAYGYRWQTAFGRNQLLDAIDALKKDSSDRQIVVQAWDPSKDGLGNRWSKNVPCPIGFMLNIIDNKLNLSVQLRSSDVVVGLAYDSLFYILLLITLAKSLNVDYGQFTIFINHAHIYESHFNLALRLVRNYNYFLTTRCARESGYVPQNLPIPTELAEMDVLSIKYNPNKYIKIFTELRPFTTSNIVLSPMRSNPEVIQ